MTIKMGLVENLMEETIDQIVGRIRETTKENTETLAGTTETIIITTATHQDSITDTVSPSTECLTVIGVSMEATHRNSTETQSMISTDTESKRRWTEHLTAGIMNTIRGINLSSSFIFVC